jgi:putative selenate reductase FAD-binding subunit
MIAEFVIAEDLAQVRSLMNKGYMLIAGGTQINNGARIAADPHWFDAEQRLVSLQKLDLGNITVDDSGALKIGAMVSLQDLGDDQRIPRALRVAAGFIPTRNVRNQATIGGNVAARRSDSYMIPALMALDSRVEGLDADGSPAVRPIQEYLDDPAGLLIHTISIPHPDAPCVAVKESRSQLALPVVSAAVGIHGDRSSRRIVVAAGCVAGRTIRLSAVEDLLAIPGDPPDRSALEAAIAGSVSPREDILGSTEYKRYINATRIADAAYQALELAGLSSGGSGADASDGTGGKA